MCTLPKPGLLRDTAVAGTSGNAGAWCKLAMVHAARGDTGAAEKFFLTALSLNGDLFDAHAALGKLREAKGDLAGARDAYCNALRLRPAETHLHFRLGVIMRSWHRLDRAAACFTNALRLQSDHVSALANLGETLQAAGDTVRSEACLRSAIARAGKLADPRLPGGHLVWSNLFISMQYNPAYSAGDLYRAHRRWGEQVEACIPALLPAAGRCGSGGKLRIGYVSADFCSHPAGRFLEPLLRFHNREDFAVICYSCGKIQDDMTVRFSGYADAWRDIRGCDDDAAAAMIRDDRIDILVDCTGHMADNRLPLFARKCAPLQISWIGYPGTTGLSRIDYRFTDTIVDPSSADADFSERLFRLPLFCCFRPPENAPALSPLPAWTKGYITFGSLHSPARLNPAVIALWSRVLGAIPGSRMLLFRTTLDDEIQGRVTGYFETNGIGCERLEFRNTPPSKGYLACYEDIDLALDTFPWSGHTTACEALWMGVPHITLRGDRHAGRMTASVLSAIHLHTFIADTPGDFVAAAVRACADLSALGELRASLRQRMTASPLCDGAGFTAAVEAAYRECWEKG